MEAMFYGGQFDGMVLSHDNINRFCNISIFPGPNGTRTFITVPPLSVWSELLAGRKRKEEITGVLGVYEKEWIPGGVKFIDASPYFASVIRGAA